MCLISLCMIVKNEAHNLERCLKSVQDVVDEMIVVDTGSKDNTREIATRLGAEVFDYNWDDSFANARNFSLEKATGRWILWMDADEEMEAEDAGVLKPELNASKENILLVQLINYYGDGEPSPFHAYTLAHHRVFRNGCGFRFVNHIHEKLHLPEPEQSAAASGIKILPLRIHHYGYMNEPVNTRDKHGRNLELLLREKANDNSDPWVDYHLASEYYRVGEYSKAFAYINQAILGFLALRQMPPSIIYSMKYAILSGTKSLTHALEGIRLAISLYPDYVDLHFYEGVILYEQKRYAEAIEVFRNCCEMGEACGLHLSKRGVGSYYSDYFIGLCYEALGAKVLANEAFSRALKVYPDFAEVRDKLRGTELQEGEEGHESTGNS